MPHRDVADKLNESVIRHMRHDLACLEAQQTVGDALAMIRQNPPSGRIIYFYVVDGQLRLVGVLPTRRLLLSPPETRISEIMISRRDRDSRLGQRAGGLRILHAASAVGLSGGRRPAADRGLVDIELYTEELDDVERHQRSDELFQLIGVHAARAKMGSPWAAFASRFPWLLCNIGGGLLAAGLAELFAAELKRVVALALFIPVVLALAESVSIQSVSLTLQTLRGQRPTVREILGKLYRELWAGGLLGIASGSVGGAGRPGLAGSGDAGPVPAVGHRPGCGRRGLDRRGNTESVASDHRRSASGRRPDRAGHAPTCSRWCST